ncbi:hypothetical protein V8C44DRAFT_316388 [Trichoderma aethiopicum]
MADATRKLSFLLFLYPTACSSTPASLSGSASVCFPPLCSSRGGGKPKRLVVSFAQENIETRMPFLACSARCEERLCTECIFVPPCGFAGRRNTNGFGVVLLARGGSPCSQVASSFSLLFWIGFVARELFVYGAAACIGELKWSDLLPFSKICCGKGNVIYWSPGHVCNLDCRRIKIRCWETAVLV